MQRATYDVQCTLYRLQPATYNLQLDMHYALDTTKYDSRFKTSNLQTTTYNLQFTNYRIQLTTYMVTTTRYILTIIICNLNFTKSNSKTVAYQRRLTNLTLQMATGNPQLMGTWKLQLTNYNLTCTFHNLQNATYNGTMHNYLFATCNARRAIRNLPITTYKQLGKRNYQPLTIENLIFLHKYDCRTRMR